ncbi:hypothetical protein B0H66DRAFT_540440 [Apodospora peruviana]|uniref:Zinc transporter n=1 Tax=Apodospora peruviana TaxID=516989 RepID=A0AAE0MEG3_9PEZI|nr:hypothetical protein B0H66DRAFT_540440 [Apodospora peruviana]
MVGLQTRAGGSILSWLPVALLVQSASGSVSPRVQPRVRQAAESTITAVPTTTTPSASAAPSLSAVSDCHLEGSLLHCMAGATEYHVHTTVTATTDIPPAFTGCHTHDAETFCHGPDGADVEISLEAEETGHGHDEEEGHDHDDSHQEEILSESGRTCHFHAGVEHCTGGSSSEETELNCSRVQREYNIPLRVGLLFAMLATSALGVFGPIFAASFIAPNNIVFIVLRQFGTGVIISTAFVHLYTHANLMFANECLGELQYESTASAILMAGIFLSFLVEYAGIRLMQWHGAKNASTSAESAGAAGGELVQSARTEMVNISVLEAGVIFHSFLIGLTLVVSGDKTFITLFIVIVFHQFFEGLALGTRIAALGMPAGLTSSHGGGHGHHHGHVVHELKKPVTCSPMLGPLSGSESDLDRTASTSVSAFPLRKKMILAAAFAFVTPMGMAVGIGVLHHFNGNDPSTIIAIGTLDALSAGILVWVGVVEMWAQDWMLGGEMTNASPLKTIFGLIALITGMALMSLLGKWA